jgi:hypothetical protein
MTFIEKREAERDAGLLERLQEALEEPIEIPDEITEIKVIGPGEGPGTSVEALELARQVYYFRHGSLPDAGVAIVEAGLSDSKDPTQVADRLRHLFAREGWPKRSRKAAMALRDANVGGLYRGDRVCKGSMTGSGPQPKGKPCEQSPMLDSEYCFHHDPRPEYVEKRRIQALSLHAARRRDLVPLEPFTKWTDLRRRELLAEARERGEPIHYNDRGWGRLASELVCDQSLLNRLARGEGSRQAAKQTIKAATVNRYIANVETTFEDIYGFEAPSSHDDSSIICGNCGGKKSHGSRLCIECAGELRLKQCAYVNRAGVRCIQRTRSESGYCSHCARIVFRVRKPRKGKQSRLTDKMMLHALDEYRRFPSFAWVAAVLAANDVDGICSLYKNSSSMTGSLVKCFARKGWRRAEDVEKPYRELLAKLGAPEWGEPVNTLAAPGILPPEPFNAYLVEHWNSQPRPTGSFGRLATKLNMDQGNLSARIKGSGARCDRSVSREMVERVLMRIDDGTCIEDVYTGGVA